ncbi:MAG: hypothetical protein AAFZ05_14950, partial [Pseudomonadota bacterium]
DRASERTVALGKVILMGLRVSGDGGCKSLIQALSVGGDQPEGCDGDVARQLPRDRLRPPVLRRRSHSRRSTV